jgi:hypothetical protein
MCPSNAVRGRHRGERVGHAQASSARFQHKRMQRVEPLPALLHLADREMKVVGHARRRRRMPRLNERPIGRVAHLQVHWVHSETVIESSSMPDALLANGPNHNSGTFRLQKPQAGNAPTIAVCRSSLLFLWLPLRGWTVPDDPLWTW